MKYKWLVDVVHDGKIAKSMEKKADDPGLFLADCVIQISRGNLVALLEGDIPNEVLKKIALAGEAVEKHGYSLPLKSEKEVEAEDVTTRNVDLYASYSEPKKTLFIAINMRDPLDPREIKRIIIDNARYFNTDVLSAETKFTPVEG